MFLSLNEKRNIFNILQIFISIMHFVKNIENDPNSLNEFEKGTKVNQNDIDVF
jgi:hypothetical protein